MNSMNDSSTGGYLASGNGAPPENDDAFDAQLHALIAGVTGLPDAQIKSHLQMAGQPDPDPTVDACVFGVTALTQDAAPSIVHDGAGDGQDLYTRHQSIDVLATFYGPRARGYAQRFVDGCAVPQNREQLQAHDLAFVGTSEIRAAADPASQQWARRCDLTVTLRRKLVRTYAVRHLESATLATTTDASNPVAGICNIHH
jgi:hypothetical protein